MPFPDFPDERILVLIQEIEEGKSVTCPACGLPLAVVRGAGVSIVCKNEHVLWGVVAVLPLEESVEATFDLLVGPVENLDFEQLRILRNVQREIRGSNHEPETVNLLQLRMKFCDHRQHCLATAVPESWASCLLAEIAAAGIPVELVLSEKRKSNLT